METIIGLLVVLLPVIFKLIGRKLEAAAQEQQKLDKSPDEWRDELRSNPDLRMLLSASSKLNEDDIKYLIALAERMNRE